MITNHAIPLSVPSGDTAVLSRVRGSSGGGGRGKTGINESSSNQSYLLGFIIMAAAVGLPMINPGENNLFSILLTIVAGRANFPTKCLAQYLILDQLRKDPIIVEPTYLFVSP